MKKLIAALLVLCLAVALILWLGVGTYCSSSAVQDLNTALQSIYGAEYTGKEVENGTEDMVFVVEPKTWFLTNWNIRNALVLDYEYECSVVFTTYTTDAVTVRTITYQGFDPMGRENMAEIAHLDLDSKVETTEIR